MNQKRVLFLGGAYSQVPIIMEAKNRGWYIITCDYLPDNPGHKYADEYYNVSTTDFENVLEVAKKTKPDFIVAYASDPAAPTASWVSEQLGLPSNSYKSVQTLAEKDLFRKFLKENGFNTPNAVSIEEKEDIEKIKVLKLPIIIKPTDSSGSKGVTRVDKEEGKIKAFEYALKFSRNKRVIAEEFIDSNGNQLQGDGFVENSKLIFSYLGDHHYNKGINPFVPYSTTWPSQISDYELQLVNKELSRAIELSGFKNGAINIEVRINKDGDIYIMEIGPRSGGNFVPQVINYSTGFNMVEGILKNINGETITIDNNFETKPSAYYVIHSPIDGLLDSVEIKDELKPFVKEYHQYIHPDGQVKSFQGANAAIGILLLTFSTIKVMNYYISNMNEFVVVNLR